MSKSIDLASDTGIDAETRGRIAEGLSRLMADAAQSAGGLTL